MIAFIALAVVLTAFAIVVDFLLASEWDEV